MTTMGQLQGRPRKPMRVIELPPSAFCDKWQSKPDAPVRVGLRSVSILDAVEGRKMAADESWKIHPHKIDEDLRVDAYSSILACFIVSRGTCNPDDARVPLALWGGLGEDTVKEALTPQAVASLLSVIDDATRVEISKEAMPEDLYDLADLLDKLPLAPKEVEMRVRRLLGAAIEELRSVNVTAAA